MSRVSPWRTPFSSAELHALTVSPVRAAWALLWRQAAYRGCLLGVAASQSCCQAQPCEEVAGLWWVELGHKVDACEVPGGPEASVGPQVGRAGFQGWWLQAWGAQI